MLCINSQIGFIKQLFKLQIGDKITGNTEFHIISSLDDSSAKIAYDWIENALVSN